jgi:hypothetical protein
MKGLHNQIKRKNSNEDEDESESESWKMHDGILKKKGCRSQVK